MRAVDTEIECAARTDAKVLVTGETGTGKEVVARLIHGRSARSSAPLVAVNCAGLPDSLLESELFGHARGAFTGAYRDKPGLLELAPNGTVFLDEVGEMSVRMQAVLLRFLETGELQRVGADRPHTRVNVRLITATNRDLRGSIEGGSFREDLYYRLNVIRISLPPLRERKEDLPALIDHFVAMCAREHGLDRPEFPPAVMEVLLKHRWPGNVRELKNVIERVLLRTRGRVVDPRDLPGEVAPTAGAASGSGAQAGGPAVRSMAEQLLERMMTHGESFWTTVYPLFMARDLTRDELRAIVRAGLEASNGSYRVAVGLFNMPPEDYKRFLGFLRKYHCHLPFRGFRVAPARSSRGRAAVGA
jgi:transcriptional regulator with PAS, ATPase and Fis domain